VAQGLEAGRGALEGNDWAERGNQCLLFLRPLGHREVLPEQPPEQLRNATDDRFALRITTLRAQATVHPSHLSIEADPNARFICQTDRLNARGLECLQGAGHLEHDVTTRLHRLQPACPPEPTQKSAERHAVERRRHDTQLSPPPADVLDAEHRGTRRTACQRAEPFDQLTNESFIAA
jgi:hypothetical protein